MKSPVARFLVAAVAVVAVTALLVQAARTVIRPEQYAPDFLCFWTAAELMASGQDPYDAGLQTQRQTELGWDKVKNGYGIYEFLPFYHAPWLALACMALLPLGYPLAKITWLVLGAESLVASAWLLKDRVGGVGAPLALALVVLFGFSIKVVAIGQLVPLILVLVALAWKALDDRRDVLAGALLAAASLKPHLTGLLIAALGLWSLRQRRWGFAAGVAGGMAALLAASTVAYPGWAASMLEATRTTPLPTSHFPGLGVTWLVLLGVAGLQGPALWGAYAVVAVPALAWLARLALAPQARPADLFGPAMIATFLVAPYARYYDYPLLMVAVFPLVGEKIAPARRGLFALTLLTLPTIQLVYLAATQAPPTIGVTRPEFTYFWVLLLITGAWLYSGADRSRQGGPCDANTGEAAPSLQACPQPKGERP